MTPKPAERSGNAPSSHATSSGQTTFGPPGVTQPSGAASQPELPEQFGRYRILKKLGQGGMGSVYLAQDTQLDRRVALKVPHFTREDGPEVLDRFYREARAAATLNHPNLCPVYDASQIDGIHYLTMAFIEGKPLSAHIKNPGAPGLPQRQVALAARKVALALHEAHRHGIIHRDLKPSNIMINARGEPIVMDFGLAKRLPVGGKADEARLTQSGAILGTPAYMSPEQVSGDGDSLGPATDIYSLGVILYEMLTARLPFQGPVHAVLGQILTQEPTPPSVYRPDLEPGLESVCRRAMAKNADDRFESMSHLAAALTDFLKGNAVALPPPRPAATGMKPSPSQRRAGAAQLLADLAEGEQGGPLLLETLQASGRRSRVSRALIGAGAAALFLLLGLILYVVLTQPKTTIGGTSITMQEIHLELGDDLDLVVSVDGRVLKPKEIEQGVPFPEGGRHEVEIRKGDRVVKREVIVLRPGDVLRLQRRPKPQQPIAQAAPTPNPDIIVWLPRGIPIRVPRPRPKPPEEKPEEPPKKPEEKPSGETPKKPEKSPPEKPAEKPAEKPPEKPAEKPEEKPDKPPPITVITDRGERIEFPAGAISWADAVHGFHAGTPPPAGLTNPKQVQAATGQPDGKTAPLGPGGHIILEFKDNYLVDVDGADLAVFRSDDSASPLEVSIRTERGPWVRVGEVTNSPTIDIAPVAKTGDRFRFVKLVVKNAAQANLPANPGPGQQGAERPTVIVVPPGRQPVPPQKPQPGGGVGVFGGGVGGGGQPPKPGQKPAPGGGMGALGGGIGGFGGGGQAPNQGQKPGGGAFGIGGAGMLGGQNQPNKPGGGYGARGGAGMLGGYGNRGGRVIVIPPPAQQPMPPAPANQEPAIEIDAVGAIGALPIETGKPSPPQLLKELKRFEGHAGNVTSVAYSPDGRYLLSGSVDKTLRLWDVETGREVRRFEGHTGSVCSVAFSPDGRLAVSGGGVVDFRQQTLDGTIRLWDVESGHELRRFTGHPDGMAWCLAFTPDGRSFLSASPTDLSLRLWNVETGKEIRRFAQKAGVWSLALSPDGRFAAAGDQHGVIRVCDLKSGQEAGALTGHKGKVTSIAFSADGRRLLSGGFDKTLRLWDLVAGREIRQIATGREVWTAALAADGTRALSGHDDHIVRLWNLDSADEIARTDRQARGIGSLAIAPAAGLFVSCSDVGLTLWELP